MNTSFFMNMKSIFFNYDKKTFKKNIDTVKPKIICLIFIAMASIVFAGCNGKNGSIGNKDKTDTVFVQPNNQHGEGEGEGEGERGMGHAHNGMGHAPNGMDTIHHKKHE